MPSTFDKWLDDITNHLRKKQGLPVEGSDAVATPHPTNLAHRCPFCSRDGKVEFCDQHELYICQHCEAEWTAEEFQEFL